MKLFAFDIDGVLCDRGQKIDAQFKTWFLNWAKDKKYYIVTGSNREKAIAQVGEEILLNAQISFHCLANNIWIQDHEVTVNQFTLTPEESQFLLEQITASSFVHKTGNHFDYRKGSINFSVVGKNASQHQRQEYVLYDKDTEERIKIIKNFNYNFPRLEAFIGGDVSIDICLNGANKQTILQLIDCTGSELHYFGDRCFKFGVDYPIAKALHVTKHTCHQIDNGWIETYAQINVIS